MCPPYGQVCHPRAPREALGTNAPRYSVPRALGGHNDTFCVPPRKWMDGLRPWYEATWYKSKKKIDGLEEPITYKALRSLGSPLVPALRTRPMRYKIGQLGVMNSSGVAII